MNKVVLISAILLGICCFISQAKALIVSRGKSDVFNNPNMTACERNVQYCRDRRARCFGTNCCKCKCVREFSTFHSPGVTYEFKDGKPLYRFDGKETCVWNHYAHEGCRFIEEKASNSSRRFLPLINLDKNGTLHLKVALTGVHRCNKYQIYVKRPKQHTWVAMAMGDNFFNTFWIESTEISLTLQWRKQKPKYGGAMLKMNLICEAALKETREPCIILKVKGTYNTQTNGSTPGIPTEPLTIQTIPTTRTRAVAATTTTTTIIRKQTTQPPTGRETETSSIFEVENTTSLLPTVNFSPFTTNIVPVVTKPAIRPEFANGKKHKPKRKMDPTNRTKPVVEADKSNDPHEDRGETFWILVYVFMAFAIFEVLCVALFFIYRHRRKRKQRRKASAEAAAAAARYENHGAQGPRTSNVTPPPAYPENIELYENEVTEPRYSSIQQLQNTLKISDGLNLIENGIPANLIVPEPRSRQNSQLSHGPSIIVLPKDCVIVHASGSRKSRHSRRSKRGESSKQEIGLHNQAGPTSDDNRSLYSWGSFSSCYRTSTDEDYVSGSNRVNWEVDSLYEEPDKVIQNIKSPSKTFGLERLFALQESVIPNEEMAENAENVNENTDNANDVRGNVNENGEYANPDVENCNYAHENGGYASDNENYANEDKTFDNAQENNNDDDEHIYESAESFLRDRDVAYYENAYDLPEDALAKCLGKPNKFALKHVLHEENTDDDGGEPSLNLGMEFVNNNETMLEGEDVKLRPTRRSTLYLHQRDDDSDHGASSC